MTTNKSLISILSSYVLPTELGGTCFYVSAETFSLESPKENHDMIIIVFIDDNSNIANYILRTNRLRRAEDPPTP